ncbi:hypothetical protein SH661x_001432 [Planctomicrobium sp. SH661]|uniref:hypothetical protein n=1 Tax=Planctomicrobium sp. SH661 TaxID=3448124 RepID=UPI003F5AF798
MLNRFTKIAVFGAVAIAATLIVTDGADAGRRHHRRYYNDCGCQQNYGYGQDACNGGACGANSCDPCQQQQPAACSPCGASYQAAPVTGYEHSAARPTYHNNGNGQYIQGQQLPDGQYAPNGQINGQFNDRRMNDRRDLRDNRDLNRNAPLPASRTDVRTDANLNGARSNIDVNANTNQGVPEVNVNTGANVPPVPNTPVVD